MKIFDDVVELWNQPWATYLQLQQYRRAPIYIWSFKTEAKLNSIQFRDKYV